MFVDRIIPKKAEPGAACAKLVQGAVKRYDPIRSYGFTASGMTERDVLLPGAVASLDDFAP